MLVELLIGLVILCWWFREYFPMYSAFPENDDVILPQKLSDKDTLPLHGIRVVELATVIAVPGCGRMLAELGAEVVKVENTNGDTWRQMLLTFQPKRVFSVAFEAVNPQKKSVVLNLKTESG